MKIVLLMAFIFVKSVSAEEFSPPSDVDLMNVSLYSLSESKKIISRAPEKDCNENKAQLTELEIIKQSDKKEVICLCELGESKTKNLLTSMIGEYQGSEITLNTGNDNFLHGALQATDLREFDGDDRGRTFGFSTDYNLLGSEGKFHLGLDSAGFGRFSPVAGYKKDSQGKYYLNFREVNTLDIRLDKNLSKSKNENTYLLGEIKLTNETDEGNLSRGLQDGWHRFYKEALDLNIIQYQYVKNEEEKTTISLMGGIGKNWIKDIGRWKCQTGLEAKGGMSIDIKGLITPEVSAKASGTVSHSSLPWVALSSWIQGSSGFQGPETSAGVTLMLEKKIKNVIIRPFIGVERHKSTMDKKFGEAGGNPFENYHVLGVTIKY